MPDNPYSNGGKMEKSVVSVCQRYANDRTRLLDILLDIQHELKGITPAAMEVVAQRTGITRVEVEGVVSFYAFLSSEIKGERMIRVCDDIIDRQKGGREIAQIFAQELGVAVGGNSADGRFSLEYTPFLGMSDQAPSVMINDTIFTALTREKARRICSRLRRG